MATDVCPEFAVSSNVDHVDSISTYMVSTAKHFTISPTTIRGRCCWKTAGRRAGSGRHRCWLYQKLGLHGKHQPVQSLYVSGYVIELPDVIYDHLLLCHVREIIHHMHFLVHYDYIWKLMLRH